MPSRLILASESPRRRNLLSQLGLSFVVCASGVDEEVFPHESPAEAAVRLAVKKAESVAEETSGIVLAADTIIDLDGRILGKPVNQIDAFRMLSVMSGRDHEVITGIAVVDTDSKPGLSSRVTTRVKMVSFNSELIKDYIQSGEPMDKAGAYAIQGLGSRLIERISGCYNNVVGFPLCEVVDLLRKLGFQFVNHSCRSPDGSICPRVVSGDNRFQK